MRDYPPPDAGARSLLRSQMRAAARRCGFTELETPSVESLDLYRVKSGEEISGQVWAFRDKGDREVALAPEATPSLARIFASAGPSPEPPAAEMVHPGEAVAIRGEPQAGRTREFLQVLLDILGVPGVEAEAEVLASAAHLLDAVGAEGLYAFRVNDVRGFAEALGSQLGAQDTGKYFRALDRYRKASRADFTRDLEAAGIPPEGISSLTTLLDRRRPRSPLPSVHRNSCPRLGIQGSPAARGPEGMARLRSLLFRMLPHLGIADLGSSSDPTAVRCGLASHYTSTVFEECIRSERRPPSAVDGPEDGRRPADRTVRWPADLGLTAASRSATRTLELLLRAPRAVARGGTSARHVRGRGHPGGRAPGPRPRPATCERAGMSADT